MRLLVLLSTVLWLQISTGCNNKCPEDVKIGDIQLTEESLRFFSYSGAEKLIFMDSDSNEIEFSSQNGMQQSTERISIYKKCTEVKFDGQSTYEYFDGEFLHVDYLSESTDYSISLSLLTTILRPETELFYDKMILDVSSVGAIGRGEIITDIRFADDYEDDEFNLGFPMTYQDTVTLNDVIFTEVYSSGKVDGRQIHFSKEKGLVGFSTANAVYHLDRIEE